MVPVILPTIGKDELEYVFKCMIEDDLSPNRYMDLFTSMVKKEIGVKYGVSLSSYVYSYDIILTILKAEPGDEVILPTVSNPFILLSLEKFRVNPILVDVDRETLVPHISDIEERVTKRTKAIIVPQLFGIPHDLSIYKKLGVPLIEDCDGSILSSIDGRKIGSFGDYCVVSFNDTSVLTAGGGAFLGSSDKKLQEFVKHLQLTFHSPDIFMSNLNAAMGVAQIKKLDKIIENRRKIAAFYDRAVMESRASLVGRENGQEIVFTKYVVQSETPFGEARKFFNRYKIDIEKALGSPIHSILGLKQDDFKNAEYLNNRLYAVPFYPKLGKKDVELVVKCIKSIL